MKTTIFALFFCFCISLQAQNIFSYSLTITNNAGVPQDRTLYFGVHPLATDSVDEGLGEEDLPPAPPMSGIYGVFKIRCKLWSDEDTTNHWSYKDYRSYNEKRGDSVVLHFSVYNQDRKTKFEWAGLGKELDSAYLSDNLGEAFRVDMKKNSTAEIDQVSALITDYRIVLYYNPSSYYSVEEDESTFSANYSAQNQTVDWKSESLISLVKTYNVFGEQIQMESPQNTSGSLNASEIPSGVFFVEFVDARGAKTIKKFIKY